MRRDDERSIHASASSPEALQAKFRQLLSRDLFDPALPARSMEEFGYEALRFFIDIFPSIITVGGVRGFNETGILALDERIQQLPKRRDFFQESLGQNSHYDRVRQLYLGQRGKNTFSQHVAHSYIELIKPVSEEDTAFVSSVRNVVHTTRRARARLFEKHWKDFLVHCPSLRDEKNAGSLNTIKLIFMQDFANQIAMRVMQNTFERYTAGTVMFDNESDALTRVDEHIQRIEEILKPVMAVRSWRMTNKYILELGGTPEEVIDTLETVAYMTNTRPRGPDVTPLANSEEYSLLYQAMLEMVEGSLQSGEWVKTLEFFNALQENFSRLFPAWVERQRHHDRKPTTHYRSLTELIEGKREIPGVFTYNPRLFDHIFAMQNRMIEKYSLWEILKNGESIAYSLVEACAEYPVGDEQDYGEKYFDVPFTPSWTPSSTLRYRVYYEDFVYKHRFDPKFGYRNLTSFTAINQVYQAALGVTLRELIGGLWRSGRITDEALLPIVSDSQTYVRFKVWLDYWEKELTRGDRESPTTRGILDQLTRLYEGKKKETEKLHGEIVFH